MIELRGDFTLLVDVPHEPGASVFTFEVHVDSCRVRVSLSLHDRLADVTWACSVSAELLRALQSDHDSVLSETCEIGKEFRRLGRAGPVALDRVMELLRFCLMLEVEPEHLFSLKTIYWRRDAQEWTAVPSKFGAVVDVKVRKRLDETARTHMQSLLNRDFRPLAGYLHLLRAKRETVPHFKYVDATIGAELAVKDALCRIEPRVEGILTTLPSPPLEKLYGRVLRQYAGEESPKKREIGKGAQTRNSLVHKPEPPDVDQQAAIVYCFDVEDAMAHLLGLLPGSGVEERFFFGARSRVG